MALAFSFHVYLALIGVATRMIPRSAFDFAPTEGLHLLSTTHSVYVFQGELEGDLTKKGMIEPKARKTEELYCTARGGGKKGRRVC